MAAFDNMKVEPGQVWEVETAGNKLGKVVIIACQGNFANTLSVWEADIPANYQLSIGGSVDTRRLIFTNYDNFRCMIDYISQSDMEQIKDRLAEAIGLKLSGSGVAEYIEEENVRLIVAERERDIWKQVAMNLMQR